MKKITLLGGSRKDVHIQLHRVLFASESISHVVINGTECDMEQREGFKLVKFVGNMGKYTVWTQNPSKKSIWAEKLKSGINISWLALNGVTLSRMVDGQWTEVAAIVKEAASPYPIWNG